MIIKHYFHSLVSVFNLFYSININNQNSLVNVLLSRCGHMGQRPASIDYLYDLRLRLCSSTLYVLLYDIFIRVILAANN